MEFDRIADERYSVRKYQDKQVPDEIIREIIGAGMRAPTGKNLQPQRIFVIKSEGAMAKLKDVCRCTFGAPMALLVCYNNDECWHSSFEDGYTVGEMDASIVTTFMMLKAWEKGVGSCWVKYFDRRDMAKAFNLPDNIIPSCILDLGYAAEDSVPNAAMHAHPRPVDEVVTEL